LILLKSQQLVLNRQGTSVIINNLPTTAPGTSGAIWRDAAAGNVLKIVP
jgi:hypothetical protein